MQTLARRLAFLAPILLVTACAGVPQPIAPLKVGSRIPAATLLDQNDVPRQIDENVRIVFFAREMEGGAIIRALLEEEAPNYLTKLRALYVADISGMPSIIANLMAIPKMQRERPYPTLLDRDGATTAAFPSKEAHVTIMGLDRLRVMAIHYPGSMAGMREAIAAIAASR